MNFNEADRATIDAEARKQVGQLAAEVAEMRGRLETAMKFAEAERTAREESERVRRAEREEATKAAAAALAARQKTAAALSAFLESGEALDLEIRRERIDPAGKVKAWVDRLESALRSELGESYVSRSRNGAGVALNPRAWSTPRIQEFLEELGR